MRKYLLILLILVSVANNLSAQKDSEHWIAPYYHSIFHSHTQALYLSTDSVAPFLVTIYSNNAVLGTVTISRGNPKTFSVPGTAISANLPAQAFTPINKGLYINASKPFFCTLRMVSSEAHAEILTSKGKAGIGKEFYVASTPSSNITNNFTAGVMATEDNTTVTATWNGAITFFGTTTTGTTQTFILNKGQSFIFAGNAGNNAPFMGAKIVADKPITLTNGNVNGNFANNTSGDQILF